MGWGCRIHRLHFWGTPPPPIGFDTKQSDSEVPVMLESPFIAIALRSTLTQSGSTLIGSYLWVKENCLKFKLRANK